MAMMKLFHHNTSNLINTNSNSSKTYYRLYYVAIVFLLVGSMIEDWNGSNGSSYKSISIINIMSVQAVPTPEPTLEPTPEPTPDPTREPTREPTNQPTPNPTPNPTPGPTRNPTNSPTPKPSPGPTRDPTRAPTRNPTRSPTRTPTKSPTRQPTIGPSRKPSRNPTKEPTKKPSKAPTKKPTLSPTRSPTEKPTTKVVDVPAAGGVDDGNLVVVITPQPTTQPPTEVPTTVSPTADAFRIEVLVTAPALTKLKVIDKNMEATSYEVLFGDGAYKDFLKNNGRSLTNKDNEDEDVDKEINVRRRRGRSLEQNPRGAIKNMNNVLPHDPMTLSQNHRALKQNKNIADSADKCYSCEYTGKLCTVPFTECTDSSTSCSTDYTGTLSSAECTAATTTTDADTDATTTDGADTPNIGVANPGATAGDKVTGAGIASGEAFVPGTAGENYDINEIVIKARSFLITCDSKFGTPPAGSACIEVMLSFDSSAASYSTADLAQLASDVSSTIVTGVFQDEMVANGLSAEVMLPPPPALATDPPSIAPAVPTQNPTGQVILMTNAPTKTQPTLAPTTAPLPTLEPTVYVDPCPQFGGDCVGCVGQVGCLWCVADMNCFNSSPNKISTVVVEDISKRGRQQRSLQTYSCPGTITGSAQVCTLPQPTLSPTLAPQTMAPVPVDAGVAADVIDALEDTANALEDAIGAQEAADGKDESSAYSSLLTNTIVLGICTMMMLLTVH